MNKRLLQELNRIAVDESEPAWVYICLFDGKASARPGWMTKHIISHLRKVVPICNECHEQHIPEPNIFSGVSEELLDAHTITVGPRDVYWGKKIAGF